MSKLLQSIRNGEDYGPVIENEWYDDIEICNDLDLTFHDTGVTPVCVNYNIGNIVVDGMHGHLPVTGSFPENMNGSISISEETNITRIWQLLAPPFKELVSVLEATQNEENAQEIYTYMLNHVTLMRGEACERACIRGHFVSCNQENTRNGKHMGHLFIMTESLTHQYFM